MSPNDYDVVVIGAGVAGLNAAIAAARHGARTMIVDMLGAGGQVINVDRIDNFPGPAEGMSGFELGPMLQMQADEAGVEFALDTIETISKTDTGFRIAGADLDLTAGAVIIAAGSAKRTLGIPGEAEFEGRGVSHCASCDGPLMRGKDVCIIGGGDSALDEALALVPHAARISVIHHGSRLRASAALQAKADEASNIEVRLNTVATAIRGDGGVSAITARDLSTGTESELPCHGVFVYVGLEPNTSFLGDTVTLAVDGRIVVDLDMQASVPGIFAAGDIRSRSVAHLAASAGDGVTAAISAVRYLAERNGDTQQAEPRFAAAASAG
ncbi:NAD(P)/FAD-dependent oxidoreductase [Neorhizobium galegae]|uniref:NAD(P)/FAD-dependent oxidoreductase n=1 Tax=Neorhizobium galegae TaxID=399 RepID=UPI002102F6B5|nr:FAD-dependent oxidoreductase [Neorhizobium galegae]MCQ1838107.1 NAD(P)/FAD-dependent oxidoreductase [Neorhizobium galegae]